MVVAGAAGFNGDVCATAYAALESGVTLPLGWECSVRQGRFARGCPVSLKESSWNYTPRPGQNGLASLFGEFGPITRDSSSQCTQIRTDAQARPGIFEPGSGVSGKAPSCWSPSLVPSNGSVP